MAAFDAQTQKPVTYTLEVTGSESVETPAGTFETWVVTLTVGDGTGVGSGTLHVAKESGTVVKSVLGLGAQMGNGTATSVLTGHTPGS